MRERYVVLGLADVRSAWFQDVARWATTSVLPIEFVKAMTAEEVHGHLGTGRPFSALIVDDSLSGLDRDLVLRATEMGCAVVTVTSGRAHNRWTELGASATLPSTFAPEDLGQVLDSVAKPISEAVGTVREHVGPARSLQLRGRMVAVVGPGGTGSSTIAMAVAQAAASGQRQPGSVCLADLKLDADQAMLHGSPDVVPGLTELADAHRSGTPEQAAVRSLTWAVPARGYQLLLGLRRHRDWTALRPRHVEAAIESLRRTFRVVVADVEDDLEGERETGSTDIEDRNFLARHSITVASGVVVVGAPDMKGVHSLARVVRSVVELAGPAVPVLPMVNRAPRNVAARAQITKALAALAGAAHLPGPVFLKERRGLDGVIRDGAPLPPTWSRPLLGWLDALDPAAVGPGEDEPVRVTPGSLGSWAEQEEEVG